MTPDLLGGAETTTIAKVVQELFLEGRDWPYGAALGFVLMLLTLGGTLLALGPLRREVAGAMRTCAMKRARTRWPAAYAWSSTLPVRADRRADHLLVQHSKPNFQWEGFTLDWYPTLFGNRPAAGRGVGDDAPRRRRGIVRRRSWARCSAWRWPACGSAVAPPTETLLLLPMVTPEIIMGLALLVFFFQLFGARGSFDQLALAHITFCISYVAIVVRARAAGMNPQLEEAARDLGASAFGARSAT